jgi:hypothetical protein
MDTGTRLIVAILLLITSVGTLAGASKTLQQEDPSHLRQPVNDAATSSQEKSATFWRDDGAYVAEWRVTTRLRMAPQRPSLRFKKRRLNVYLA